MHLYRIEIYLMNEATGLTVSNTPDTVLYADDHEQARNLYNEYRRQRHENNSYKYTVKLAVLSYKNIEDPKAFLNQFEA